MKITELTKCVKPLSKKELKQIKGGNGEIIIDDPITLTETTP